MNRSTDLTNQILSSMEAELACFVEEESKITSSTEYEEQVLALAHKFAASVIQYTQGHLPKSRNSKKKS